MSTCSICKKEIVDKEMDKHLHEVHHYSSMNVAHLMHWGVEGVRYTRKEDYE